MSAPSERVEETTKRRKGKHGFGTKTEIEPKVWRLRAPGGVDQATGKFRQVSRTVRVTKPKNRGGIGEADEELRKLVSEVRAGQHVGTSANFSRLATDYLAHTKRTKDVETYNSYRIKIEKVIEPELGPIKLANLTAHDLDTLYSKLAEMKDAKGKPLYASTTIEHTHNVLSGALTQAVKWGWIDKNVAKLATPPKAEAKERLPLPPDDTWRMIRAALKEDVDMGVLIYMLCLVGGRRGEACGFQWGDVDWERQAIKVERQIVPTSEQDADPNAGYCQRIKPPKGNKKRVEAIGAFGVQVLMGYQDALRQRLGENWKPQSTSWLISPDGGTTPIRAKGVTPYIKGLGERLHLDARPHDFRRFSATQLGEMGIPIKTISERMGHGSLSTTAVYMKAIPESDMAAADAMGQLLHGDELAQLLSGEVNPPMPSNANGSRLVVTAKERGTND